MIGLFSCSANFIIRFVIPSTRSIFFFVALLCTTKICYAPREGHTRIPALRFICLGLGLNVSLLILRLSLMPPPPTRPPIRQTIRRMCLASLAPSHDRRRLMTRSRNQVALFLPPPTISLYGFTRFAYEIHLPVSRREKLLFFISPLVPPFDFLSIIPLTPSRVLAAAGAYKNL